MNRDIPVGAIIILLAGLSHFFSTINDVVYLPGIIIAASLASWSMARPELLIIGLIIFGELFTAQPIGAVTASVLLPYLARTLGLINENNRNIKDAVIFLAITFLQIVFFASKQLIVAPSVWINLIAAWIATSIAIAIYNYYFSYHD